MTKMFRIIGIDLDKYPTATWKAFKGAVENSLIASADFGSVIKDMPTRNGYHYFISLYKPVGFWQSIGIRYVLGDDTRRMFFDMIRYRSGANMVDTLWDIKRVRGIDF